MGINTDAVQRLYVAYFNRPADTRGLAKFEAMLGDTAAGQDELAAISGSFSGSAEYKANFEGLTNPGIVNKLYQNIFGRQADLAGLNKFSDDLDNGVHTVESLALYLSYAAQGTDKTVVDARIEAAVAFTNGIDTTEEVLGYQGLDAAAQGRAYLAQISGELPTDDATITAEKDGAILNVDASIAAAVAAGNAVAGEVTQLTTAVETVNGTAGDDTIQGSLIGDLAVGSTANPSDQILAGDGTDTFQLSVSGTHAAGFTLSGLSATSLEKINISNFETDNAQLTTLDASLLAGVTEVNLTSSAASGDTSVTNLSSIVTASMANGSANLTVGYQAGAIAGATSQTLKLKGGVTAATATIAGVEAVTVDSSVGANTLADLVTANATSLALTGTQNLSISAAAGVDFDFADAALATAVDGTVDATGLSGSLAINMNNGDVVTVLGGPGALTLGMADGLTAADTITGGAGSNDTIDVTVSEQAALALVTGVENLQVTVADIDIADGGAADGTGAVTLSGAAISSVTNYVANVTTATNGDVGTVNVIGLDDGDTVTIVAGGSDTTGAGAVAGISLATAFGTDSSSNSATVAFNGIGAVDADASNASGYARVEVDEVETLTLTANTNAAGTVTTSGVELLTAQAATSITATGAGSLAASAVTNTTLLTSIDASAMTGNLTLTGVDASVLNYKGTQGNDALTLAGLANTDTFDGNGGTDAITATGVTGLTATTGALNVTDVDSVILNTTGANTIDAASMTDVGAIAFTGNHAGTQTVTNLAASGTGIVLGTAAATMDGGAAINVSLADETGGADTLAVTLNNAAAASTDTELDFEAIESLTIAVDTTTNNNAIVDLTNAEANNVTVTGGAAGALLTFGATDAVTNNIDLTGYAGEVSFSAAAATSGVTLNASSAAAADDYTLSGFNDTATIATTAGVAVDIDMGAGTGDVLNLTVTTAFADTTDIDGAETINLGVVAGADITIGANGAAATTANGISEATSVVLTGGNELSTFTVGSSGGAAAGDTISGTTLTTFDASGFGGNIDLEYAVEMPATLTVSAGALTTDVVRTSYDAGGTDILLGLTGVERFVAELDATNNGAETYTFDLGSSSGLTRMEFASGTIDTNTVVVDSYSSGTTIQLGTTIAGAVQEFGGNLDVNMVNSAGTSDVLNVRLQDTEDGVLGDIDAAGIETTNLVLTTDAQSHNLNLAGISPTVGSAGTINISGGVAGDGITVTAVAAGVTTIDASTLAGTFTLSDRGSTAMTITGGTAADSLRMENAGDVMTGGTGSDTLVIVQNAVLGGFAVDLSSATDQVTTYNGSANAAVQVGFENVDLSGITGSNGADITAAGTATVATASTILSTPNVDNITLGSGVDTLRLVAANLTANDTINGFNAAGADVIQLDSGLFTGGDYQEAAAITAGANADVTVATTALADDAAIITAIQTSTDTTDTLFVMGNTATGQAELWYDANPNVDGGEVKVGTFSDIASTGLAAAFATGDFTFVA